MKTIVNLSKEEIDKLNGRKLDKLVDWYIFGRDLFDCFGSMTRGGILLPREQQLPNYCSDINDALTIIEELDLLWFEIGRENAAGDVIYDTAAYNDPELKDRVHSTSKSLPLAICRTALKYLAQEI